MINDHPALAIRDLTTGYGHRQVLFGVNLGVSAGELVAVLGHNGSGKSTMIKAVLGILPVWSGSVDFGRRNLAGSSAHRIVSLGISMLPQGNSIFGELTIQENLQTWAEAVKRQDPSEQRIAQAIQMIKKHGADESIFGKRISQRANVLSGGEKQLLSLACTLTQQPKILLMDEPSLGLSPDRVRHTMHLIRNLSKSENIGIILVEQRVQLALEICDRALVLRMGKVVLTGSGEGLAKGNELREALLA